MLFANTFCNFLDQNPQAFPCVMFYFKSFFDKGCETDPCVRYHCPTQSSVKKFLLSQVRASYQPVHDYSLGDLTK